MAKAILILATLIAQNSFAGKRCFTDHVVEAIDLNLQRAPIYYKMDPRTKTVSQKLIAMERLLLPFAHLLDLAAQPYQKKDLGFMCEEFVEISETPALEVKSEELENPVQKFSKPPGRKVLKKLRRAMIVGDFLRVETLSDQMIEVLSENYPNHFCLRRHFLESIRRIAGLAPHRILEAKTKNLKSPRGLILDLLKLHSFGLWKATAIDRLAIPLQNQGIAILCNDVPEIPVGL